MQREERRSENMEESQASPELENSGHQDGSTGSSKDGKLSCICGFSTNDGMAYLVHIGGARLSGPDAVVSLLQEKLVCPYVKFWDHLARMHVPEFLFTEEEECCSEEDHKDPPSEC